MYKSTLTREKKKICLQIDDDGYKQLCKYKLVKKLLLFRDEPKTCDSKNLIYFTFGRNLCMKIFHLGKFKFLQYTKYKYKYLFVPIMTYFKPK